MYKTLFIIGNGFDLDLNLKTSYHDFWIALILEIKHQFSQNMN